MRGSGQYAKVAPHEQPAPASRLATAAATLSAPFFGSRHLFPKRFDAAVSTLLRHRYAGDIPLAHARWYFGPALQLRADPARLRMRLSDYVADERGQRWIGTSFVDASEWTAALSPLEDSPIHREMVEVVQANLAFRDTRAYQRLMHKAAKGTPRTRNGIPLASAEQVEAYFAYCIDLISSIRQHGILSRMELSRLRSAARKHRGARPLMVDRSERDIGVAIGAAGELVRNLGGKHRTAIAQALMLTDLPVEVQLVHVRWLERHMVDTGLPAHHALRAGLASMAAGPSQVS